MNAADHALPEATFLNFLSGIGSQGLMQLGKIPNPVTGERDLNLPFARYTIDLLKMLRSKSDGNRSDDEETYLNGLIADLEAQLQVVEDSQQ